MSGLDISEKRLPQDGRFNIRVRDQAVDVRISTMPTQYGESVVMRLLNQSGSFLTLDKLGMPPDMLKRFREIIQRSNGMVLVTGPTGSGKTTTLYAGLAEINTIDQKIITVEDPVEYRLPGINQVQVNEKIELSFSRVLRSALRQDPGRDPGRRNARCRNCADRHARGDDRSPGIFHPAHPRFRRHLVPPGGYGGAANTWSLHRCRQCWLNACCVVCAKVAAKACANAARSGVAGERKA